ncbi:MAG: ubiquinol-cytochrome c reductase iron-sulfur subunit [Chloroflexota bacterium]
MKKHPFFSRRNFIKLLLWVAGFLGLGGLVRFFSFNTPATQPSRFELGDVKEFPEGSRTIRVEIPAVIYNQAGNISAYSLICTHLGCRVEEKGSGFECPCHGSVFDHNGKVIKGPAQEPLPAYDVEISEDRQVIIKAHE